MADEQRIKRSAKKPAWMNDEMLIDPAEVEPEVKMPKPHAKKPHAGLEMAQRALPAHHEFIMPRQVRPSGRMCSNPQCKNPFDSPQWRRGPLGPGTLCNACGTRYARLQAKMNGDKKGKMRPQERAEWEAFEQQRLNPQVPQQTWRMHVQHFVQREQQQQYYGQEEDYADYQESDYGYDERSYGSQGAYRREQHYGADDMFGAEATEEGQLMCQEGLEDSPGVASRAAAAAAAAATAAAAAAVGGARPARPVWRGSRQHIPTAEAATDSQEDEAAAYSYSQEPAGLDAAGAAASSPGAPSSLLHLLAVGEAMIKTEGVAPQERRAAYSEVVGKGMGPEPEKPPARTAAGDPSQGVKRSRFALEAEEQQAGRPGASAPEPTALQRALERCGVQAAAQQRSKPAGGSEHVVTADRFERLLAEAEACVRARSVSPCMLKGVPGPGASPIPSGMPAPRPITPLQLGVNAVDAASGRAGLPRSFMGVEMGQQEGQHGIASFMLPGAAVQRRPASATASDGYGRGRHASLAQAVAAAAAAEANSPGDEGEGAGMDLQDSPNSQYGVSASNADSVANRGDAARVLVGADVEAHLAAAGSGLHHDLHGFTAGDMPGHMQVLLGQMPSTEPSPMSKMLLADEVLSPSTMHMPAHARPRKQARTQGPAALGVAASGGVAGRAGSGSNLSRSATPADRVPSDGIAAANLMQSGPMQQHLMVQQGHDPLLQQAMLQQGQQQQAQGMAAAGAGAMPGAAELQQAGHRPVVLACQLVLQQQSNPVTLRPLFGAPAASAAPAPTSRAPNMPGIASSAGELVNSALQLAQTGSGGNAQTHLDQLKAVTESAQAAAATASAVAAATALLWQQLQQQEQARARQREQELRQQGQEQDVAAQGQQEDGAVGAGANADAGAGAGVVAANEPAAPGSPAAAAVADPAAAQAASGSISRSSSSSTSAAGLSTAPGDSHGVEQPPPAGPATGPDQQQQAPQGIACQEAAAPGAEAVFGGAAVGAEGHSAASVEEAGAAQALSNGALLVPYLGPMLGNQGAGFDASQQGHVL